MGNRRWFQIHLSLAVSLSIAGSLFAADSNFPHWDSTESIAAYAQRASLPSTQVLDLGNGVKLDLVLIPAGKFSMGTPEPTFDEGGFKRKILMGQVLMALSAFAVLGILAVVIIRSIREKRRPQISLGLLVLMILAVSVCLLGGLHWQSSAQGLHNATYKYAVELTNFKHSSADQKPAHVVTLTQPFYMGKFVVTQEQYQQVIGMNPSSIKGTNYPVESVAWDDAQAFCKKLTEQTRKTVRLPTEAEWEYACRAGTTTTFYSGENETELVRAAWFSDNSNKTMHPVGLKEANAFGLFDMCGNVWQWCQDWYDKDYYLTSVTENPKGPDQGDIRVMRGGSWINGPTICKSAYRGGFEMPTNPHEKREQFRLVGFRVVVPASRTP